VLLAGMTLATALHATSMSDAATPLQPGQWTELATANFNQASLGDGDYDLFYFTDDLAWDPLSRQVLFVGGGHSNDADFLRYSEANNTWSRSKPTGTSWHASFSHAYDHNAIIPSIGKFFFRQPAAPQGDRLDIYDIATGTWSRSAPMPVSLACCGGLEYFPELGGLVLVAGPGPILFYDPATDAWRTLSNGEAVGDYHNFAQYSPTHRVMIFGGGEGANGAALFLMDSNRRIRRLNNAPQRMGITHSVVTTDPVTGNFLVFFDSGAYDFNPVSQAWTQLPAPPWLSHGSAGIFNVVATPVASYDIILFAKYDGDDSRVYLVYLYRHAERTALPPQLDFSANPLAVASGDFSVLSWTSTDVTQCLGTSGTPSWPGNKAVPMGSESVGPIQARTTFGLSCSGPGGAIQRSVSVDLVTGGGNSTSGGGGGALGPWLLLNLLSVAAARAATRALRQ
jgi:hypothetical protein